MLSAPAVDGIADLGPFPPIITPLPPVTSQRALLTILVSPDSRREWRVYDAVINMHHCIRRCWTDRARNRVRYHACLSTGTLSV